MGLSVPPRAAHLPCNAARRAGESTCAMVRPEMGVHSLYWSPLHQLRENPEQ